MKKPKLSKTLMNRHRQKTQPKICPFIASVASWLCQGEVLVRQESRESWSPGTVKKTSYRLGAIVVMLIAMAIMMGR